MEEHKLNLEDFDLDEIESIELIGYEDTIDITVDDTHMFYANDIYTHNSSIKAEVVESDQMGGSIKKAQIGHFIVSVARSNEQKDSGHANLAILKSRFGKDGIVLSDCIFDNSRVQIEIVEQESKTFLQNTFDKNSRDLDRVKLIMDASKKIKES